MNTDLANYLLDLVYMLRQEAHEAAADVSDDSFESGRGFAYREVLSTMQCQADAFGIDRASIGLQGFDPFNGPLEPTPKK